MSDNFCFAFILECKECRKITTKSKNKKIQRLPAHCKTRFAFCYILKCKIKLATRSMSPKQPPIISLPLCATCACSACLPTLKVSVRPPTVLGQELYKAVTIRMISVGNIQSPRHEGNTDYTLWMKDGNYTATNRKFRTSYYILFNVIIISKMRKCINLINTLCIFSINEKMKSFNIMLY